MPAKELIYRADNVTRNMWEHNICSLKKAKKTPTHSRPHCEPSFYQITRYATANNFFIQVLDYSKNR